MEAESFHRHVDVVRVILWRGLLKAVSIVTNSFRSFLSIGRRLKPFTVREKPGYLRTCGCEFLSHEVAFMSASGTSTDFACRYDFSAATAMASAFRPSSPVTRGARSFNTLCTKSRISAT